MAQTTLINDVYGVVGSQGEITDLNVDGKNLGLVRAVTSPGGGITFESSVATVIASLGSGAAISATSFPGVDATGATDCTDALNAPLAALPAGSIVFFPPGTYMAAVPYRRTIRVNPDPV